MGARVGALVSAADRAAGAGVFAPHTYANLSGKEAGVPLLCTPAGFERYCDRLAAEYAGLEPAGAERADPGSARRRPANGRRRQRGEPRLMRVARTPR